MPEQYTTYRFNDIEFKLDSKSLESLSTLYKLESMRTSITEAEREMAERISYVLGSSSYQQHISRRDGWFKLRLSENHPPAVISLLTVASKLSDWAR